MEISINRNLYYTKTIYRRNWKRVKKSLFSTPSLPAILQIWITRKQKIKTKVEDEIKEKRVLKRDKRDNILLKT